MHAWGPGFSTLKGRTKTLVKDKSGRPDVGIKTTNLNSRSAKSFLFNSRIVMPVSGKKRERGRKRKIISFEPRTTTHGFEVGPHTRSG